MSRREICGSWIVVLFLLMYSSPAGAFVIDTYAGNGVASFSGDGGPATQASIFGPLGLATDGVGNIYIADNRNERIRKVDPNGNIVTVAGDGSRFYPGDGHQATQVGLASPWGVATDGLGNFFFSNVDFNVIRKVDVNGIMTTVVGNGSAGFSGDGGPATQASISFPAGLALDGSGNLYFADMWNHRIRKVDGNGTITTVAGNGTMDFSGDGGPATQAGLRYPYGLTIDVFGNLFIADTGHNLVRKVDANGIITTVSGRAWTCGFFGDGGPANWAYLCNPQAVRVDSFGNLFISDSSNFRIRRVDVNGIITTVAGNGTMGFSGGGGPATQASFWVPQELTVDGLGNLYVSDIYNNRVRRLRDITPPVTTLSLAGIPGENGWYWSDVLLTLTATDDGSGVSRTEYSLDAGGTWNVYTGPLTVANEGSTVIDYRSVDNMGSVEPYLWDEVKIDRIAPVIVVNGTVPANGAVNVPVGQTIEVTFSESAQEGTSFGNIKLYRGKIDPTKEVQVSKSIAGNVLYIDSVADLNPGTTYRVVIPAGSVKDVAGHPLTADYPPYSFETAP